jgi:hypothetical protein
MLRNALIVLTIIATAVGSLGLPIYLHTCRMMSAETESAGCAMCSSRDDHRPVVPATGDDGGPCCGDEVIHQRVDTGTLARAEMPMPLFVGLVTILAIELDPPVAPTLARGGHGHSPPELAARSRLTYLLNSTFLI